MKDFMFNFGYSNAPIFFPFGLSSGNADTDQLLVGHSESLPLGKAVLVPNMWELHRTYYGTDIKDSDVLVRVAYEWFSASSKPVWMFNYAVHDPASMLAGYRAVIAEGVYPHCQILAHGLEVICGA